MEFYKKLAELRKQNGLSQLQVATYLTQWELPTNPKTVSQWENAKTKPDIERFVLFCKLCKINDVVAEFSDSPNTNPLDSLNLAGRQRVEEYIELLSADSRFVRDQKKPNLRTIPFYSIPVSAGLGSFLDSDDYELIELSDDVPSDVTFAVRVSGDSMRPEIDDGQIVFVKQQQTLELGQIGIFYLNGESFCKQWGEDQLISLNEAYKPMMLHEQDEFRIFGKVVAWQ